MSQPSFYETVGGRPTFERLVTEFYRGVADDPVLKPMYPEEDLGPAAERLTMFLEQYWGGPGTYSEQRGHPRLRLRHQPYKVNPDARDRCSECGGIWLDPGELEVIVRKIGRGPLGAWLDRLTAKS